MRLWAAAPLTAAIALAWGCHEEPTIVIQFQAADLSGARAPDAAAARAPDMAPKAAATPSPASAKLPVEATRCKGHAECVSVPVDCCDCNNGGALHAVAKRWASAHKAERAKRCADTMCTAAMSADASCKQHAACVAAACALVDGK
jgi:hypothetical protein